MKKLLTICLTLILEFVLIWLITIIFKMELMEILLLASIVIFAVIWLLSLFTRNASNQSHAHNKGYLGYKTGEIRLFTFRVSPIILGVISFALVSLIATVIYYASYF